MAPKNHNLTPATTTPAPEGQTNREQVEEKALALTFATDKTVSLLDVGGYGSKAGAVTYSSVRAHLKKTEPKLVGAALTERVNAVVQGYDVTALAAVIQLTREGFKIQRLAGRELKNGTRTASVKLSNGKDKADKAPVVKIEDMSDEALLAIIAARKAAATPTLELQAA